MKPRQLLGVSALWILPVFAQDPVTYTVRFPAPHTHYLEVEASFPAGKPEVELFMPVWTPGSYLVREYERQVENFKAQAGPVALRWEKSRKNRWKVYTGGAERIGVSYRVYARDAAVQGNWVDAGFAMLNGAPNFMTPAGGVARRHEVRLVPAAAWKGCISGMPESGANGFIAADYDELVDSPIYCGNAPIHEFAVAGKKHYLVNEGEGPMWDGPASARDVQKIVEEYARMWNGLPYEKYVFFNMIVESGGGLEHRNSTWMNTSRWAYGNTIEPPADAAPGQRRPNRVGWLGLVSHEYFHLWNVKRLRPVELGPFDYENEVYSKSLWVAEGVTSYYGGLALKRAGLRSTDSLLRDLGQQIRMLQSQPGRLVQPLESSSYDAWIKLYRPDENSPNTSISYYTKGALAGWLLDAKIRKLTNAQKSLDDVMRLAYARYSGRRGYTPEEFRQTAAEVANSDLSAWFEKVLDTTAELDYSEALDYLGLRFKADTPRPGGGPRVNTGLTLRADNGRLIVSQVRRGTPGYDSGINVNDEILAINDYRVRAEQWASRLESYKPGNTVSVLVARRDQLMRLDLKLEPDRAPGWQLELRSDATPDQKASLKAWLREP